MLRKCLVKFPGAQISFSETLKDHIRDFVKSHPDHNVTDDPIQVKISADGAKMSRTTNFMILSFALLQTGKSVIYLPEETGQLQL
jgi:hypothetical protein